MLTLKKIDDVRRSLKIIRERKTCIGFVPTMGALHEGHLELIRRAKRECGFVVVSIFVNPTQFGQGEDFQKYPRSIEEDLDKCRQAGVDLVFNPEREEMYPEHSLTTVQVAKFTDKLCGEFRPGHFTGVTTVVTKLFNIVMPDIAYFGQKDAQQALVIRRMIQDLNFPVELRICPTVRSESGLALSSRNRYLSESELRQAACLYQSLQSAKRLINQGNKDGSAIMQSMRKQIELAGPCQIQYIGIVDMNTFDELAKIDRPVLIALAVRIGPARLIDNIILDSEGNETII
ncbi:MAG: pantoate--beta-alanine ligase [Phycisphaerae bacterium]